MSWRVRVGDLRVGDLRVGDLRVANLRVADLGVAYRKVYANSSRLTNARF